MIQPAHPDNAPGQVIQQLVGPIKRGVILVALDGAAPSAGELPGREDLTIFVAHPCCPSIFNDETDPEARRGTFGGLQARQARQAIVYAPMRASNALGARDFILGHRNVEPATLFGRRPGVRMSDAARRAVERAKTEIFAPGWKKVFEPAAIAERIHMITRG